MKCIISISFIFLTFNFLHAQNNIASFGKVDKADLEMKDCSFDKDAEAVLLFDIGEVYCTLDLNNQYRFVRTEFNFHRRIKILNTKGLDRANIRISYHTDPNIEDIKNLMAQTINLDASGNIVFTKVEKEAIFRKKINKRYSEIIFTFPEVKPGSIIEFKYKDDADEFYGVKSWNFQSSIPVAFSKFILDFPSELIVNASHTGNLPISIVPANKGNRSIQTFEMNNIPALRNEPYITDDEDYLQKVTPILMAVDFPGAPRKNLLKNWPTIVKEIMNDEDFGSQLKKKIPRTSDLDAMISNVKDPYKKMAVIHDYVKKNMEWDGTYSIWALDGVKAAWKNKKGTAGEINLILANLLRDADIDAHPVLVSTKSNGRVNTSLAGYEQFNKVMVYINLNNTIYVLDATDKTTPTNIIPPSVLNSEGLVIEKYETFEWGWKTLWNKNQQFDNTTILNMKIDERKFLTGNATVVSKDYSRLERMPKLKEGKEKFIDTWILKGNSEISVDSFTTENENVDSVPLTQHFNFSEKINSSGDYNYFSLNLFSALNKNPFIADERFSDVFFGANQHYIITGNVMLDDTFKFETLPKNLKMIMPDSSIIFTRLSSVYDNALSFRINIDFLSPFYQNADYPYLKEFYKKSFNILNEQFVFKKK